MPHKRLWEVSVQSDRLHNEMKRSEGKGPGFTASMKAQGEGPLPPNFPEILGQYKSKKVFGAGSHSRRVLGITRDYLNISRRLTGERIIAHIGRLTHKDRTVTEKSFGMDFMQSSPYVLPRDHKAAQDLIGGDSESTRIWWTLSPYLHHQFVRRGISPRDSIRMLIDWANAMIGDKPYFILPGIGTSLEHIHHLERPTHPRADRFGHKFAAAFARKFAPKFIEVFGPK